MGDALELAADDDSVDAVVMLGPLYHLVDRSDRVAALREAYRVLRLGGVLVAEVMTRHSWLLDTALKEKWGAPEEWERLEASLTSGRSLGAEAEVPEGAFFAYFHQPSELLEEFADGAFSDGTAIAVEGFARLLGDLERRMSAPEKLLRAIRLSESVPSMLGVSAHVMGVANRH